MIEVKLERAPGGYLLNGTLFLSDLLETPEGKAVVKACAQALADELDRRADENIFKQHRTAPFPDWIIKTVTPDA